MSTATPIIGLAGKAGSGKDTVGNFIARNYNGVCIGQADPMKKFCMDVFGFSEEQLWGPSELRNASVKFDDMDERVRCTDRFDSNAQKFIDLVLPKAGPKAFTGLQEWYDNLYDIISDDSGSCVSPRAALQTLGTNWGRSFSPEMWNEASIRTCKKLLAGGFTYSRTAGLTQTEGASYDYACVTDLRFRNEILNIRYEGGVAWLINRPSTNTSTVGVAGHASEKELDGIPNHFYSDIISNRGTIGMLYEEARRLMQDVYEDNRESGELYL